MIEAKQKLMHIPNIDKLKLRLNTLNLHLIHLTNLVPSDHRLQNKHD